MKAGKKIETLKRLNLNYLSFYKLATENRARFMIVISCDFLS